MFIIHTISSNDYFGAEKVLLEQCKALIKSGNRILIVVIRPQGACPLLEKLKEEKLDHYHLVSNSKFDLKAVFMLKKYLEQSKGHLVQSQGYKADIISLLACRLAGIPIISTIHGWTSEDAKVKFYENIQAYSWRFFDKVICVSEAYKKKAKQYGVPEEKIQVIYNGIYQKEQIVNSEVNGCFATGIIGRLSIEKGHQYFLEAAKKVLQQEKNVKFLIVGDGPEEGNIKETIAKLHMAEYVHMLGYVKDMASVYRQIDAVVIPSLREGLPNVLLEAMLNKKLVIASGVGGIPEVILDGVEGVLVKPQDSSAISEAIIMAIRQAQWRKTIVQAANKKVIEHFSFESRMQKIEALYQEVIKGHKAR